MVMNNLSSHKGVAVRSALRAVGKKLFFLPLYSPDLNPIEQAFSLLKILLRKKNVRTQAQTTDCIGKLLKQVTPTAVANNLQTAEYT